MKILQRYFFVNIAQAVAFALVAFLCLIAFMDLTQELPSVGKGGYMIQHAILYVLLLVPGHVYETMPVAALLGTIYTMAQFAQSSEFTIMRASSMSTQQAGIMLAKIGAVFVAITFLFGELVAPRTAPVAERVRLSAKGATIPLDGVYTLVAPDIGSQINHISDTSFVHVAGPMPPGNQAKIEPGMMLTASVASDVAVSQ